ncbi:MAG: Unknown protein [uncultured Campylobacterales bacterium]|uniref:Uncharacterized protein n=1 Tax=uncultured Campylobacterales bacterium TaxID=352960 RepID=A0A6S6TAK6_9BACT|nr:MAG: Unknown protein [uncultured Campylobacterales bacterium]
MSQEILIPLVIAVIAGVFLYKNVNVAVYKAHIEDYDEFEFFKQYSMIVETYVEEIIQDLQSENPRKYILNHSSDSSYLIEFLKENKRTLNFFQTELSKSKSIEEIQANLFDMLSKIDDELNNRFQNGKTLASQLKETLQNEYQKLKNP